MRYHVAWIVPISVTVSQLQLTSMVLRFRFVCIGNVCQFYTGDHGNPRHS